MLTMTEAFYALKAGKSIGLTPKGGQEDGWIIDDIEEFFTIIDSYGGSKNVEFHQV